MAYASTTPVPVERTRAQIETLVSKYGAARFASGWESGKAMVMFEMRGRRVRFVLQLPYANDDRVRYDARGGERSATAQKRMYDQITRSMWRGLWLVIKAKLESVEANIATFEEEFLSHIVLPGTGETFGEWAQPHLEAAYRTGDMPPMLTMGSKKK